MSLDIAVSGISIIKGNPKIAPELFAIELSSIDKGPYELNRIQKISAVAFMKALSDAGLALNKVSQERIAIFLGNTYSIEEFKANFLNSYKSNRAGLVNPSVFAFTNANSIASWLGVQFGVKGNNLTFTNGCISGSQAIIAACDSIISGKADVAVAGGISLACESLEEEFYKCGFKHECVGFLILERKEKALNAGRRAHIIIEDFRQGFLSKTNIEELNNRKLPIELENYCCSYDAKHILMHLGNSLSDNKFSYNNTMQGQDKAIGAKYLNDQQGNAFSAAGVLGVSCINRDNCVFLDVDSYGAYAALKINAE
jgi:hypothetical protein